MSSSRLTAVGDWLVECLNGQICAGTLTRDEAIEQIRASLERVKHDGYEAEIDADEIATAMIAALACDVT